MQGYPPGPPVCPECRKPMKLVRTIPRLGALREMIGFSATCFLLSVTAPLAFMEAWKKALEKAE